MNVIKMGDTLRIYGDDMEVYKQIPVGTYTVRFSDRSGFFMEQRANLEVTEQIFGHRQEKVSKVLNAYPKFAHDLNRNLGVILSGDKGIGKSLFAKMLCVGANDRGYPVIVVDSYLNGIADFLEHIEQEALVLFDEFDKTFGGVKAGDGHADPQAAMLSLFDGITSSKKLFVITCNELSSVNSYLVNRPGRFHYHFRFEYPNAEEIREYLLANLDQAMYRSGEGFNDRGEQAAKDVTTFSSAIGLNYDCLRAIVFELNQGLTFDELIPDINILNIHRVSYSVTLRFTDGTTLVNNSASLDLFGQNTSVYIQLYDKDDWNLLGVGFDQIDCRGDTLSSMITVDPEKLRLDWDDDADNSKTWNDKVARYKALTVEGFYIRRKERDTMRYHRLAL